MDVFIIKNFKNLAIVLLLVCVVACALSGVSAATKVVEKNNDMSIDLIDETVPLSVPVIVKGELEKINDPNDISTRKAIDRVPPIFPVPEEPQDKTPEINIPGMIFASVDQVGSELEETDNSNGITTRKTIVNAMLLLDGVLVEYDDGTIVEYVLVK